MKQNSGYIGVDSEIDVGTEIRIYLPYMEPLVAVPGAPDPTVRTGDVEFNATVMVVDDEPMLRHLMGTVLRKHKFRVLEADDGRHAVEQMEARGEKVDLVVTDVMMPNMNGLELADWIAEHHPDVPIILVTGFNDAIFTDGVVSQTTLPLLLKPYKMAELVSMVQKILAQSQAGSLVAK